MRVPSRIPSGEHRIRIQWEGCGQKLERVFTFTMENPDFGKPVSDPDVEALAQANPDAKVAVLQQGLPGAGNAPYAGCADTLLDSREPDANYGAKNHLIAGPYGGMHQTLIRFDLSALPPGAEIVEARLKLFYHFGSGPRVVRPYRMLKAWGEGEGMFPQKLRDYYGDRYADSTRGGREALDGECAWNFRARPEPWGLPGCGKPGDDYDPASLSEPTFDPAKAEGTDDRSQQPLRYWVAWGVGEAAKRWVTEPAANHGLLLRALDGQTGFAFFFSSEFHDLVYRPKLIVVYRPRKE
ncbi:MAG: DNRLRE domain-containing protein [Planctomycetes bacterium]|nr:DNRLRE domain-containing protein [Planctomycetota bacterium]